MTDLKELKCLISIYNIFELRYRKYNGRTVLIFGNPTMIVRYLNEKEYDIKDWTIKLNDVPISLSQFNDYIKCWYVLTNDYRYNRHLKVNFVRDNRKELVKLANGKGYYSKLANIEGDYNTLISKARKELEYSDKTSSLDIFNNLIKIL